MSVDEGETHGGLLRWSRSVEARTAEALARGARIEEALERVERALAHALAWIDQAGDAFAPTTERVERIAEVAHDSGEAAKRTDLLALNFQVEAARLGEDDRGFEVLLGVVAVDVHARGAVVDIPLGLVIPRVVLFRIADRTGAGRG